MGVWQTVPAQIRHRHNAMSVQDLHCLLAIYSIFEIKKIPHITPKIANELMLLIKIGQSIWLNWVKICHIFLQTANMVTDIQTSVDT